MKLTLKSYLAVAAVTLVFAGAGFRRDCVLGSGRTLRSRATHRRRPIVLQLRGGGEVTCDKSLVEKILPDEVPFKEPEQAPVATNQHTGRRRLR